MSQRPTYSLKELQTLAEVQARKLYGDKESPSSAQTWMDYKMPGFEQINQRLRAGEPYSEDDRARLSVFGRWRFEKDATLYRGVKRVEGNDPFRSLLPNDLFVELGYLSTSYTGGQARKFGGPGGYFFTITAPKHAAFVAPDFPEALEHLRNRELTFPPGSQLLIQKRFEAAGKQTRFEAVLLPPRAPKPPADDDVLQFAEDAWEAWHVQIDA